MLDSPMPSPPDRDALEQWAVAAGRGDEASFEHLVRATVQSLTAMIAARAPSPQVLDEVIQETYVAALEGLSTYESQSQRGVVAWLRAIARNKLADEFRRRKRQPTNVGERLMELAWVDPGDVDTLADDHRVDYLRHCLGEIRPEDKKVLVHRYVHGVGLAELAQQSNTQRSALAVRIFRLREALRKCIDRQVVQARMSHGG